ncbi:MAG: amidohydrolase [Alphaproteobacteria bacterium]|nr:amidohydrolase [Alphaproteobacteria bacterium]MBU1512932.1 amidohydrolase [Alphaproteobacteria bacterium]MBU2096627.1 amidohydrolase [Alphaproteobacteria bacterium]MBU2150510.1 amidohydrolase [Alphaproteobacteria bacterium]MBU2306561.1 amidohydrolase [Alphaproteobacteria bacterium]
MNKAFGAALAVLASASLAACATITTKPAAGKTASAGSSSQASAPLPKGLDPAGSKDPFPSTYRPLPSRAVALVGATVLTGTGAQIDNGTVLIRDGKIAGVGAGLTVPADYETVDARGKWVTPGLIDTHSHAGVYPSPEVQAHSDGNEATDPNTAQVWAEHSVWPQDPTFNLARAGGVTTLLVLPGSANLFGGRGVTLRNVPARTVQGMKFPGAPYTLKMACGENPKRVYGGKGRAPSTRMGNVAGYRAAWINASDYMRKWDDYRAKAAKGEKADPPKRDLQLDTLVGVLKGEILVENHCYRADEMAQMIDIANEFGYRITAFHHAVEAYKIADLLAKNGICTATWTNWWGSKLEMNDSIEANVPLVEAAGACGIIKSDDPDLIQRLNQEAAEALAAGRAAGLTITEGQAIRWITANPAKALGIAAETGSLEVGKRGDVTLWDADPFSIYARAQRVWIDGGVAYDRTDPRFQSRSDFELGLEGRR